MAENINARKSTSIKGATSKESVSYQQQKDREKVKGQFQYYETPGGVLGFNFRKYKEDPIEKYLLVDGEIYSLPLGVARHLNTSGKYPVHKYITDEKGVPKQKVGRMVSRYGFNSLEFIDLESSKADDIITIEKV